MVIGREENEIFIEEVANCATSSRLWNEVNSQLELGELLPMNGYTMVEESLEELSRLISEFRMSCDRKKTEDKKEKD